MAGFNLKSIKQVFSAEIQIKDPNGEPLGVTFEMAGPEHPERKRIIFAQNRKFLKEYQKSGGKPVVQEPEDLEAQKLDNLAAFTLGWKGLVDDEGKAIPFSKQAALDMYRDPEMAWLVDQLDSALGDKELFITRSAKA